MIADEGLACRQDRGEPLCIESLRQREVESKRDKEFATKLFLECGGGALDELDWRPTETIPEDFYAY